MLGKKNALKIISFSLIFLVTGCSSIYYGIEDPPNFNPNIQSDTLGDDISLFEDGMRTTGKNGEYEWWYFDSKLDDGSVVVSYFWKLKAIKDVYYVGVNYNKPDGTEYKKIKFFKKKDISLSKEMCDVSYGDNLFKGDLKKYHIKIMIG